MKYQTNVSYYSIFSNKPISILSLYDVIEQAKNKNKFGMVFQFKKQKYRVEIRLRK
jgi:hypothetical protein